jgi:hypothetical protein
VVGIGVKIRRTRWIFNARRALTSLAVGKTYGPDASPSARLRPRRGRLGPASAPSGLDDDLRCCLPQVSPTANDLGSLRDPAYLNACGGRGVVGGSVASRRTTPNPSLTRRGTHYERFFCLLSKLKIEKRKTKFGIRNSVPDSPDPCLLSPES